jgi:hypothetical protein
MKYFISLCISLLFSTSTIAQKPDGNFQQLNLTDMSAFRPQSGNWRIVGDVVMDPTVDIHQHTPELPASSKKGKKKASPQVTTHPFPVTFSEGTGILLNMNDDQHKTNLQTIFEHGDIELEIELMVPKGSNSGLYLQGRYEVQILDSWGVRNPSFSDIGGIYRNWENTPGQIYMGKAPLQNAAKAPGLWQKFHILFQAPRFDHSGNKISNAKFISVDLNGVRIHNQLEVPLATGGPIDKKEAALGPIMIQGDHGPVAFRNFKYKLLREVQPAISEVTYQIHHGHFKTIGDFQSRKPEITGVSKTLTCEVIDVEDVYGSVFKGEIGVPENGKYQFRMSYTGGAMLVIDGKVVIDRQGTDQWPDETGTIDLVLGVHNFEIYYYKDAGWMQPRLALWGGIAGGNEIPLHAYNSYPPDPDPVSSIFVKARSNPRLLRAFLDFKGDRSKRLTHTIGVGLPEGINYIYDLSSGNISCLWHGDFVDATPMWHDRGDGSFRPLGAAEFTFVGQPLAYLSGPADPFPAGDENNFRSKGYEIEPITGLPIFRYVYDGLEVSNKIFADLDNKAITNEVTLKERGSKSGLYFKAGEGSQIRLMPDGSYAVDDSRYYIRLKSGTTAEIRKIGNQQELIIPFNGSVVSYTIVW